MRNHLEEHGPCKTAIVAMWLALWLAGSSAIGLGREPETRTRSICLAGAAVWIIVDSTVGGSGTELIDWPGADAAARCMPPVYPVGAPGEESLLFLMD